MTQSRHSFQTRLHSSIAGLSWGAFCLLSIGCVGGSEESFQTTSAALSAEVGAACILDDESHTSFSGFSSNEVNLSTAGECSVGMCMAYHFNGRVSCPEGQDDGGQGCLTPEGEPVAVPVEPQLEGLDPEDGVFCTCRCDGKGEGPFCECPGGFTCEEVFEDVGIVDNGVEVAGSYCVPS